MDRSREALHAGDRRRLLRVAALAAGAGVLSRIAPADAREPKGAADGGRTILITGATSGLGRRAVERLWGPGTTLLVHGRDRERGEALLKTVREAGGEGRFHQADFASLAEVRGLADAISRDGDRLDVLVNNAGIYTGKSGEARELSSDGHELRFAVNYLATFALTQRLLPLLRASGSARIVNVASAGQNAIDFDDVMLTRGYSAQRAYGQSKLAMIMYTIDLAQELRGSGVTANSLHPATYMDTPMVRAAGVTPSSTVEEGADALLRLVNDPALKNQTGLYFNGQRQARASAQAYDEKARERLRALSLELTKA